MAVCFALAAFAAGCTSRPGSLLRRHAPETIALAEDLQPLPSQSTVRSEWAKRQEPTDGMTQLAIGTKKKRGDKQIEIAARPVLPALPHDSQSTKKLLKTEKAKEQPEIDSLPRIPALPTIPPLESPKESKSIQKGKDSTESTEIEVDTFAAAPKPKPDSVADDLPAKNMAPLTRTRIVSETSTEITLVSAPKSDAKETIVRANHAVGVAEWSAETLVAEVLASNPTLAQMESAWQAAAARYPQVHSLDDPMLSGGLAPTSLNSSNVQPGYRIELAQKIPFPGKLKLRGDGANADSSAARNEANDTRAQLIESAKLAFYDYYFVTRATEVNNEALQLLKEFRQSAEARYRNGLVTQQDILQADVEIGRQKERGLTLERMRRVAIARINTLRNAPVQSPVPAAPRRLALASALPCVEDLRSLALGQRADLRALEDRVVAEQAALALAQREFWPDAEVSGAYDTIMGNGPARDLAPQIGMRLNIPLRISRRHAAVAEAEARIAQRRAESNARANLIQLQVQEAFEQVHESERILDLYEKTILPAARDNVSSAQTAYVNGKVTFLNLVDAQRNLVNLRDRLYEATADYHRRLAALERAVGGSLPH